MLIWIVCNTYVVFNIHFSTLIEISSIKLLVSFLWMDEIIHVKANNDDNYQHLMIEVKDC